MKSELNPKALLDALLEAETAKEVDLILSKHGFDQDDHNWRPLGDTNNNRSVVQNQMGDSISALAEKATNAVDAVLMDRCLVAGDELTGPTAPQSLNKAIARYFFNKSEADGDDRFLANLHTYGSPTELTAIAQNMWIVASGNKKKPSLSIVDNGIGQSPDMFERTFCSLIGSSKDGGPSESSKAGIPFVQGKFNQGGSASLVYASYQLVVSRRNQLLVKDEDGSRSSEWGFTLMRKVSQNDKGSTYKYLAPVGATPDSWGSVLSVATESLPLLPEKSPKTLPVKPRVEEIMHGTLVKLFDYEYVGSNDNIMLFTDNLKVRLETVLSKLPIPLRLCETRFGSDSGSLGSFQSNLTGIFNVLERRMERNPDKFEGPKVVGEFPVGGADIQWTAYVTKQNLGLENERGKAGVIVSLNGQRHGKLPSSWFANTGLRTLYRNNTIVVEVDASNLNEVQVEDLFAPSRDRMNTEKPIYKELFENLKRALSEDESLKSYNAEQRERQFGEGLANTKPVKELVLEILKRNPALAKRFKLGGELNPGAAGPGTTPGKGSTALSLHKHPTLFTFKDGKTFREQVVHQQSEARVAMILDAEDDYFYRDMSRGSIEAIDKDTGNKVSFSRGNLRSGSLNLTFPSPKGRRVGFEQTIVLKIIDPTLTSDLECELKLTVEAPRTTSPGGSGTRVHGGPKPGSGGPKAGIDGLNIKGYYDPEHPRENAELEPWPDETWRKTNMIMDVDEGQFNFRVNLDGPHMREYKNEKQDMSAELIEQRYTFGMAFLCVSAYEATKENAQSLVQEIVDLSEASEVQVSALGQGQVDELRIIFVNALINWVSPLFLQVADLVSGMDLDSAQSNED